MIDILCYMPTYSPNDEASGMARGYTRETNEQITKRLRRQCRAKPSVYFDAIDSVLNNPTPVRLVVGDGRSTESIRDALKRHHRESRVEHLELTWHGHDSPGTYALELYPEKMSQWTIFNDIMEKYSTAETEYFVYTSSDIIWTMDWVAEAIKAFDADPKIQILFPCVSRGDGNLPCQIALQPRDLPPFEPPYQRAARAPVLNGYAMIFRMSFLRAYGGYPDIYRNCHTESFLHYMAEAVGGKMMVLPRGHVFHHSAVDAWCGEGGWYNYTAEQAQFHPMMDKLQEARIKGEMDVQFLKELLYKNPSVEVPVPTEKDFLAASGIVL